MRIVWLLLAVSLLGVSCAPTRDKEEETPPPKVSSKHSSGSSTTSAISPVTYVKAHPEFRTDDRWIWSFSTNGTFKAYALTSAFSYTFEGSWTTLKDDSIQLTGTRSNGYTKKSRPEVCIITSIASTDDSNPPVVQLEKTVKSELELMTMPTKPSTATE